MTESQNITTRIAMWSTPRSLSTALMRSWESRSDTIVVDEPLHGVFIKLGNWQYEGREEVIEKCETDWKKVIKSLLAPLPEGKKVYYQKHLVHHTDFDEIALDWIYNLDNCFLVRNPREIISSYLKKWPDITGDLGFAQMLKIFRLVKENKGKIPPVIDAQDLQTKPKETLTKLCEYLGIAFSESMLSWKKGKREKDGPWTKRGWYDNVSKSSSFKPYKKRDISIPAEYEKLCKEAEEVYNELKQFTL